MSWVAMLSPGMMTRSETTGTDLKEEVEYLGKILYAWSLCSTSTKKYSRRRRVGDDLGRHRDGTGSYQSFRQRDDWMIVACSRCLVLIRMSIAQGYVKC